MTRNIFKCFTFSVCLIAVLILLCLAPGLSAQSAPPATTNIVYQFLYDGLSSSGFSHGDILYDELVQGADGNFYGTTFQGGSGGCLNGFGVNGCGTIFKLTPSGTQTVLYNFTYDSTTNTALNGIYPYGGLVQGRDGNFYGTTAGGGNAAAVCNGTLGCGVIFRITPSGTYTVMHTLAGAYASIPEGGGPTGRLLLASDGNFYGTTTQGGYTLDKVANQGTIFRMSPNGAFTTLISFEGDFNGFSQPDEPYAGLTQGKDGNFYGTSIFGGTSGAGTVFKYSTTSGLTVLHSFPSQSGGFYPDGATPKAALVQASDGNLYGVTPYGGTLTTYYQSGTLFRITPSGTFTKLWDFNATHPSVNGISPIGGLIVASDGNLYGTTSAGGPANSGTLYQLTTAGALSQLLSFDASTIGALPEAVPLQAADGTLYITNNGGTVSNNHYQGAVVQVANGLTALKPTIQRFSPTSGPVGTKVTITGAHLVGTKKVLFNGTSATFVVKSTNSLTATVPTGSTSGKITVTNAGGSAVSAATFTVQ